MTKLFNSLLDPELIRLLGEGAIGVIPTDTVYGLVACASSKTAIEKLYSVKSRERQPGTTIGASISQLKKLGFPEETLLRAEKYWPDAVSIEMSAGDIPKYLSTNQQYMAARIPNHKDLKSLLEQVGPLMTTSANAPKDTTSTDIKMAQNYFGDTIDFYVDGGDLSDRPPSTIIGIRPDQSVVVYRQGAVIIS